jgi:uncharacterized membrane protein YjfL (UPF0719 family)
LKVDSTLSANNSVNHIDRKRGESLMNAVQVIMTGVLSGIGYFLLVAFAHFNSLEQTIQLGGIAGVVAVSFLVVRKMFP